MSKEITNLYTHGFKMHLPNLLDETIENAIRPKDKEALRIPLIMLQKYLYSIAERCAEINDPILNKLMVETTLYEVGNPESEDFDQNIIDQVFKIAKDYKNNQ